jgi:hypothetical protein
MSHTFKNTLLEKIIVWAVLFIWLTWTLVATLTLYLIILGALFSGQPFIGRLDKLVFEAVPDAGQSILAFSGWMAMVVVWHIVLISPVWLYRLRYGRPSDDISWFK